MTTPEEFRARWPSIAEIPCVRELVLRAELLEDVLRRFVDDEDCSFDHHGCCRTHGVTKPCRNTVAWALLGEDPS